MLLLYQYALLIYLSYVLLLKANWNHYDSILEMSGLEGDGLLGLFVGMWSLELLGVRDELVVGVEVKLGRVRGWVISMNIGMIYYLLGCPMMVNEFLYMDAELTFKVFVDTPLNGIELEVDGSRPILWLC